MKVKAILKKVPLLVLLLASAVILQPLVPPPPTVIVFYAEPVATAVWEVTSPHNYIGSVITATLRITTKAGVSLDLGEVPTVGRILTLPVKPAAAVQSPRSEDPFVGHSSGPQAILEGELEVLSRTITRHDEGDLIVTELAYEFMYIMPIDLSAPKDDKRMPANVTIYKEFLIAVGEEETVVSKRVYVPVESAGFFIEPRVDGSLPPIFTQFPLTPPTTYWREVTLVGFGCIGLAACIIVLRGIRLVSIRRRQALATMLIPPVAVEAFLDEWRETGDYDVFKKALVCFLNGVWGRKPSTGMKVRSYFILFSGVMLTHDQIDSVFAQVIREVHNDAL